MNIRTEIEINKIYKETNIDFSTYVSKISSEGIKIIDPN